MLTKQEQCAVTLAGCVVGMVIAAVTTTLFWAMVYRPFWFWLVVIVACIDWLLVFAVKWVREWRSWRRRRWRERRQEMWICLRCGKLNTLDKHVAHMSACQRDRTEGP